ncbi:hypothetical protein Mal52_11970 [Symmachiella dynata]|uniref:Uncharacterized protein n=1 Tax=Symmachiella dynata TaxID=2527995 RepID=A0A517ZJS9_9PLAN|nr:hypothetical protein [Symmachiella dynata]QDU42730.1 hypothetical protein Mal52_11970 [Symmachiella dynata]
MTQIPFQADSERRTIDEKTTKRVDSLYRNIKQLLPLGCLAYFVPVIGFILLPILIGYTRLRSNLRKDYAKGLIQIEEHDSVSPKPGELSPQQKLEFLLHGNARLWIPTFITVLFWGLVLALFAYELFFRE